MAAAALSKLLSSLLLQPPPPPQQELTLPPRVPLPKPSPPSPLVASWAPSAENVAFPSLANSNVLFFSSAGFNGQVTVQVNDRRSGSSTGSGGRSSGPACSGSARRGGFSRTTRTRRREWAPSPRKRRRERLGRLLEGSQGTRTTPKGLHNQDIESSSNSKNLRRRTRNPRGMRTVTMMITGTSMK
ncbi:hypothetical protein ABKV19_012054 [Rosa sericea]